jgi:hypothetical protein
MVLRPREGQKEKPTMYGPLVAAGVLLFVLAAIILWLSDVNQARSRRAIDRIFREGSGTRRLP